MKKLAGLVIILAALILGSYYAMGYLTERKLKEDFNVLNESNGLKVKVVEYNRGWFTSKVLLDWHLHLPERNITGADGKQQTIPAEEYQLHMPLKLFHGPVIFADKTVKFGLGYAHTVITLPSKIAEQFNSSFAVSSIQPKLDLSLLVSYLNNTTLDSSIPAFKLLAKQGNGQFEWIGMTSTSNISSNLDKINGNVTIDGIRIIKEQTNTTMSAITGEYNLNKSNLGLYIGDANLSLPSLVVLNKNQKIFELNQFDIHSDTNIEEGLFSSNFKMSVEKLFLDGKTYGPANLGISIRNLDAVILVKLNDEVNKAQQGPEVERQKALIAMLPELPKLFNKGPEFEITEMNMVMPQGKIDGHLLVSLPKTETNNPFELIQKVQGNGKLRIPVAVLKEYLTESFKQKLSAPKTVQDGIVQQMQQQSNPNAASTNATTATITQPASTQPNTSPAPQPTTISAQPGVNPAASQAVPNPAEINQQAASLADKQLASMVQLGILMQQGSDYVIEMNLNQSKLSVNGKPFDPAMLKFQ